MKKNLPKNGFTLIELIVSSLLVAVVTLGIVTINTVLSNNTQDYGQRYLVKSSTQTTLNHILNNASLAYGSVNSNDEAILIGSSVGDANSFCVHQLGTNNSGANAVGAANDIWLCYSWSGNQISWCAEQYDPSNTGTDPRGATSCSTAQTNGTLVSGTNVIYLGTAYSSFSSSPPTLTSSAAQLTFAITIQNCLNNSLTSCNGSGKSTDQADNPEVQLSGSVIPLQTSASFN